MASYTQHHAVGGGGGGVLKKGFQSVAAVGVRRGIFLKTRIMRGWRGSSLCYSSI